MTTPIISSAIIAQATLANMNAWVGELVGSLIASGITQTNSSGQLVISGSAGSYAANISGLPSSTGVANAVGFVELTYNDTLAKGTLSTTALRSGGTGYTNGTNIAVVATGAVSGATANATCTVTGGVAANLASLTSVGNFIVGEQITVTGLSGGSGANWTATALSTGSPVIFRLDFGANSATSDPGMWITVGQGTNGAGVIAGTAGTTKMAQVASFSNTAVTSTGTAYNSYFCYNAVYGTCLIDFKVGSINSGIAAKGGFYLYRSNDTGGNATGTSISLVSNGQSATAVGLSGGTSGFQQTLNFAGAQVYPTTFTSGTNGAMWQWLPGTTANPYGLTTTLENSTLFLWPTMILNPAFNFSAYLATGLTADIAVGTTTPPMAIIGTNLISFLSCGNFYGTNNFGLFSSNNVGLFAVFQ